MRLIGLLAVGVACWLGLSACAGKGNAKNKHAEAGDYYGGNIHTHSFPDTYGGQAGYNVGRPNPTRY